MSRKNQADDVTRRRLSFHAALVVMQNAALSAADLIRTFLAVPPGTDPHKWPGSAFQVMVGPGICDLYRVKDWLVQFATSNIERIEELMEKVATPM